MPNNDNARAPAPNLFFFFFFFIYSLHFNLAAPSIHTYPATTLQPAAANMNKCDKKIVTVKFYLGVINAAMGSINEFTKKVR